ncbi:PHP domain-containing protein [hot springs metagenome]|uniref:PHP domain-containing protein n=1 Tax=hot springs metagenome TaxID=433727 RepID=A0A5J4L003_9ZZZZ
MKRFIADLHIHTCLSPCAELDMTPLRIIDTAVKKGIDVIAISDHNSAENAEIAVKIAMKKGIMVLPSMEITSQEEAHVLAIFDSVDKVMGMQEIVYRHLPNGINDERVIGYQVVVNENDEVLRFNKRILFSATILSLKEIVDTIHSIGGIAIASHIDKEIFSVVSQFGFIPGDIAFDALEISYNTKRQRAESVFGGYKSIPWITSSDAHHLADLGRRTVSFFLDELTFDEIKMAFKGMRKIEWNTEDMD